jgi:drug/metabolite transporter (DMT)-like permease
MDASHNLSRSTAISFSLVSAALFGLATPAVKWFIAGVEPQLAAGVLYLGMGGGLAAAYAARGAPRTRIEPQERGWLVLSLVCGGLLAPWLIFWGLAHATATSTSLLANTEVVFSTLLARFFFNEHYSGRLFLGVALILGGTLVLSGFGSGAIDVAPAVAIVVACALWGLDNNAMRKVSHGDASFIGSAKGLIAGSTNVALAFVLGAKTAPASSLLGIAAVGALCYGLSFGLYVKGLRVLGAARTSAYYGTAPFAGALAAIVLLHEPVGIRLCVAAMLMGVGVWLHLSEPHPPAGPHAIDLAAGGAD